MTDAPIENIERELEEDVFIPGADEPDTTPFAELSRLMVVGIDSGNGNQLSWIAQEAPNGAWETNWTPIANTAYGVLGTGSTLDGRVAIAAQTQDAAEVHYIDEAPQGPNDEERWNPAVNLGKPRGVTGFVQLAMTRDASGRISIFGVDGNTGNVWWIYQNPMKIVDKTEEIIPPGQKLPVIVHVQVPEPPDQPWSGWIELPGDAIARLTVANNADGRAVIVGTGQDPEQRTVFVNQMKDAVTLAADQWTGWVRIDTPISGPTGSQPTAMLDQQGKLNIFMIADYTQVVQIRQAEPGSATWSQWVRPGMMDKTLINVISAIDGDGHILLVAVDENMGLHSNMQVDSLFQQWTGWRKIAVAPGFGEIAMDYNADGRVSFFQGTSKNDGLSCISQFTLDSTSWDAGFTLLTDPKVQIFTYGVVRDLTPPGVG